MRYSILMARDLEGDPLCAVSSLCGETLRI